MNGFKRFSTKRMLASVGVLLMGGGSIGLLAPSIVRAQTTPGIFNEPPYNRAPNTQPIRTPEPDQAPDRPPVTSLKLADGKVNLRLVNKTGTQVAYEVIGDTDPRQIAGRSDITLSGLRTPMNLVFYRPDRGFLIVDMKPSSTGDGTLEVTLTETDNQDLGASSVIVNPRGEVFVL